MILYQATNTVNGKVYIGITRTSLTKRISSHLYSVRRGSETPFHCAVRKYGIEQFEIVAIAESFDWKSLQEAERIVIRQLNSFAPNGYNITPGGDGFHGKCSAENIQTKRTNARNMWASMTEEERKERGRRISEAKKGKKQPWAVAIGKSHKGTRRSEDFKKKVSAGMKRYVGTLDPGEMARRGRGSKSPNVD